jgi:type I restriction-modification system DNA methylase subunit
METMLKEGIQVIVDPTRTPANASTERPKGIVKVSDAVREVLERCAISGTNLYLPEGQLDRKIYAAVNKILEGFGGKWNRKEKAHVFSHDPRADLEAALGTGLARNYQKELQAFYTPDALADRMVNLAKIQPGDEVLEPSAGRGALIEAILRVPGFAEHHFSSILAIEQDHDQAVHLAGQRYPRSVVTEADFLSLNPEHYGAMDVVLMNPPFAKGAEVEHVTRALAWLKPGGRLVAVMSNAITFRQDHAYAELRRRLARAGTGSLLELPDNTFKASGTGVKTVLIVLTITETAA